MQAVLTAQASLRQDEGNQYVDSQVSCCSHAKSIQWPSLTHSLLAVQAVPPGAYAGNNSTVSGTNVYPPVPVTGTQGPSSAGGVSQDPHGALRDETISLDSAAHSMGASRAALAGSSFADSEVSTDRQSYRGLDIHGSAYDYGSQGAAGAAPAFEAHGGSFSPGVQVSSTPILGGEGTYTVQPLSYASRPTQQQQHAPAPAASNQTQGPNALAAAASQFSQEHTRVGTPYDMPAGNFHSHQQGQFPSAQACAPAMAASGSSYAQAAPAAAASYSSLNSSKGLSEARQVDDSSSIEIGRSPGGFEALQRGRAEAANSGLQDERSLRSFFSSGIPSRQHARHVVQAISTWSGLTSCATHCKFTEFGSGHKGQWLKL